MSSRFEQAIHGALLAGAITLAGCTVNAGGSGSSDTSTGSTGSTNGGSSGDTTGSGDGTDGTDGGTGETGNLTVVGAELDDTTTVRLTFSEAVQWGGANYSIFSLHGNAIYNANVGLASTMSPAGFQNSGTYAVSELEFDSEDDTVVWVHLTSPITAGADNGTGFLRLTYTDTNGNGFLDVDGNAMEDVVLNPWDNGNVAVPTGLESDAPFLVAARVVDTNVVELTFSEAVTRGAGTPDHFVLNDDQYTSATATSFLTSFCLSGFSTYISPYAGWTYTCFTYTSTLTPGASTPAHYSSGASVATVTDVTQDGNRPAVLRLHTAGSIYINGSDTGWLRLSYGTGLAADQEVEDQYGNLLDTSKNFTLSSQRRGNVEIPGN